MEAILENPAHPSAIVYIIEDDEAVRESIRAAATASGYRVETYASARDFWPAIDRDLNGCIVTDVRMQGMSGLDLLAKLSESGLNLPVIVITGYADVPLALEAMKLGAIDFLEKPFHLNELIAAIRSAINFGRRLSTADARQEREPSLRLTHREEEVLRLILAGLTNREAARRLGISERTVESHKTKIMNKTGATSLADLHRIAGRLVHSHE